VVQVLDVTHGGTVHQIKHGTMRLRRILSLGGASILVLIVFTMDVIQKNVELDISGLWVIRNLLIIGATALVFFFFESLKAQRDQNAVKKLGLLLIASVLMLLVGLVVTLVTQDRFDSKNYLLIPLGYDTLFLASFVSILFGVFAILVFRLLRDLTMYKRKKGTQRNFLIFTVLLVVTSGATIGMKPLEQEVIVSILFGLAVTFAIVNSFRLSWIVYLTKREKIFSLVYGFLLFGAFIVLNIILQTGVVNKSLLYYSYPLSEFVSLVCVFGNIYFGMAFVSTLFHLPTAEAFDRKTSEVSSLHNLSKLITQVFDFGELVDTVTTMTLQVCEAKSCWLEIIHPPEEIHRQADLPGSSHVIAGQYHIQLVGMKNISRAEVDALLPAGEHTVRDEVLEDRRPIVVDDVYHDTRFKREKKGKPSIGSLVVVPLVSHSGLVGILYATKDTDHSFFKDDVDVISAFADQATIAIENSRLIKTSLERERLTREMMLAQDMQKRLLPQSLPQYTTLQIDAISTPAFEVGGDYYDFVRLDERRLGIIVGDVSGKGVSAAFYMSEVKGIFQALSRMYPSPREFMMRAHEALSSSIDKRSFISIIYAVLDTTTGALMLARAGHCPMLLVSERHIGYIRPAGIGLGLSNGDFFSQSIEEHAVQLQPGDICMFYTDGVTEARRGEDEFGYERLLDATVAVREKHASEIKHEVLESVRTFTEHQANHDDLTLVVLKWCGKGQEN